MYIRTDDNHNIIELIIVGVMPEKNGYEVDKIDEEIMRDILNYKYIDGEFIKSETDIRDKCIDEIRSLKIANMSQTCNMLIEKGIDFGGSHYSLTTTDQINLMKLESVARLSPETQILYHADGEGCREFSNEEIIAIATLAIGWITYNTTYFNQLKAQINEMTDIDDIISINYGMTLNETYNTQFMALTEGIDFTIDEVIDEFDYESLIPKVSENVVNDALNPPETGTPSVEEDEQTTVTEEPWKPNTDVYVPDDEADEADEEPVPYEPDIETNVDDHVIEDMVIPDTSTEVEWEEEIPDESEEVIDEETDTELPV